MKHLHLAVGLLVVLLAFAAGFGWRALMTDNSSAAIPAVSVDSAAPSLAPRQDGIDRSVDSDEFDGLAQVLALPVGFTQQKALYALAGHAGVSTLSQFIAEAASVRDSGVRRTALSIFFTRFTEVASPRSAIRRALRLEDADARETALQAIAETLSGKAPEQANTYAAEIHDPHLQEVFTGSLETQWVETEPDRALQHLARNANEPESIYRIHEAMSALTARDPQRAMKIAGRLEPESLRADAEQSVILTWSQNDPETAIQYIESLPPSRQRRYFKQTAAAHYAREHPEEALAWAQRSSGQAGMELMFAVLNEIAEQDPQRALDAAETLGSRMLSQRALQSVISHLAWQNPEAAARHLGRVPEGIERSAALEQIAGAWAQQDFEAASAWVTGLEEPQRSRAVIGMGRQLAWEDPMRAARLIDRLDGAARVDLIRSVASGYATQDPMQAQTWISQFESEPNYSELVSLVAQHVAEQDPDAALKIADRIDDTSERDLAIGSIVSTWANADPATAAEYVASLPSASAKLAAVDGVVYGWARYDAEAARRWAARLEPDDVRDQALSTLVSQSGHSADETVAIITAIRSETQREEAVRQAVQMLAYDDRDAARKLLGQLPASDAQKETLQCWLDDPANFGGY
ncbi:hypothetical protein BH24PSE2_BH24PSE2_14830 [soil metagenome]